MKIPIEDIREKEEQYYPFFNIMDESLQFVYDKFGQKGFDKILSVFSEIVKSEVENILEGENVRFDEWIENIQDSIEEWEHQNNCEDQICDKVIHDMYSHL